MSYNGGRFIVAEIATAIILAAIWYSKSRPSGFGEEVASGTSETDLDLEEEAVQV